MTREIDQYVLPFVAQGAGFFDFVCTGVFNYTLRNSPIDRLYVITVLFSKHNLENKKTTFFQGKMVPIERQSDVAPRGNSQSGYQFRGFQC